MRQKLMFVIALLALVGAIPFLQSDVVEATPTDTWPDWGREPNRCEVCVDEYEACLNTCPTGASGFQCQQACENDWIACRRQLCW